MVDINMHNYTYHHNLVITIQILRHTPNIIFSYIAILASFFKSC